MSSPSNQPGENRGIDWLGVTRTLLIQVFVLLVLSGAFIRYLDWSSGKALAEFSVSASQTSALGVKAPCAPKT